VIIGLECCLPLKKPGTKRFLSSIYACTYQRVRHLNVDHDTKRHKQSEFVQTVMYIHSLSEIVTPMSQCRRTKVTSEVIIVLQYSSQTWRGKGGGRKNGPPLDSGSELRVVVSGLTFASSKTPPERKTLLISKVYILQQTYSSMDDYSKILTLIHSHCLKPESE
jgi:hypothetical protein